ncbi:MAG: chemotaxis protein CheX [Candidatus Sumerlaeia bacterium]
MSEEMKTEVIRPFLESTLNVLKTMAFLDAKPGKPFLKSGGGPKGDVTGLIGMASETISGSMALVFPQATILQIVSSMLAEEYKEVNQDVLDCVGELTNMISGGARAGLAKLNMKFEMAIPSMIQGEHHIVEHRTKGPVICIPFELETGTFYIECTFKEVG